MDAEFREWNAVRMPTGAHDKHAVPHESRHISTMSDTFPCNVSAVSTAADFARNVRDC